MRKLGEYLRVFVLLVILAALIYLGATVYIDSCDYIIWGNGMQCVMDMR